jgi:hypothetical protein
MGDASVSAEWDNRHTLCANALCALCTSKRYADEPQGRLLTPIRSKPVESAAQYPGKQSGEA